MINLTKLSTFGLGISYILFSLGLNGNDFGLPSFITMNRIAIILLFLIVFFVIAQNRNYFLKNNIYINLLIFCLFFIVFWGVLSILFSPYQELVSIFPIITFILIIITVILTNQLMKFLSKEMFYNILVIGELIILLVTCLILYVRAGNIMYLIENPYSFRHFFDELTGLGQNRYLNGLSFLNFFSIGVVTKIIKKKGIFLWISFVNVVIFFVLSFFSGSRQTILAFIFYTLVLVFMSFFIFGKRKNTFMIKKGVLFQYIVFASLIAFFAKLFNVFNVAKDWFNLRFIDITKLQLSEVTEGRFAIYHRGLENIYKYPLFGTGPNTFHKLGSYYTHNGYLNLANNVGIIPIFIILLFFLYIIFQGIKQKNIINKNGLKDIFLISLSFMITFLLIMCMFNDLLDEYIPWIMITIFIYSFTKKGESE